MKKFLALMLTVVLSVACVVSVSACTGNSEKVVALITLHGSASTYDKNFIDAFEQACKNKGLTKSQYTIVSDIAESEACYSTAADLADQGYKAIFADSFGHEDYLIKAAKERKDVQFYHATGTKAHTEKLDNFHNAFASIYEGRYLAGYAAGLLLNTMKDKADQDNNFKVGYIGAFTYAEVISGYTSWFLGLREALDDGYTATMDVTFTGSWYDETGEKEAAQTLISGGAVLVSQHADSMGAPTACDDAGIPNVAYNGSTGKNTMVSFSKINWVPYFEMMIDQAKGGNAVSTDWTGTIDTDSVQYALGSRIAEGTADKVNAIKAELVAGTRKVFDCSKFTVGGENLSSYLADVNTDADFTPDTEAIKTVNGITFFAESEFRSAPYFDITIDGVTLLNTNFG